MLGTKSLPDRVLGAKDLLSKSMDKKVSAFDAMSGDLHCEDVQEVWT